MLNKVVSSVGRNISDKQIQEIFINAEGILHSKRNYIQAMEQVLIGINAFCPLEKLSEEDKMAIFRILNDRLVKISGYPKLVQQAKATITMAIGSPEITPEKEFSKTIVGPINEKYVSMLEAVSQKLIGEKLLSLDEAVAYYQKLYKDPKINTNGIEIPSKEDLFTIEGSVFLNKEFRMNSINLLNKFVKEYFKNENRIVSNKDKVKVVLSVLMLSGVSALNAIQNKIESGLINPLKENPSLITLAGTGNPIHFAHILTALEALAYSDDGDVVEFIVHAIDPRKTDLLHFFHRFSMDVDILKEFQPLIRMHDLDDVMHKKLGKLAEGGIFVNNIVLDSAYTAGQIIASSEDGEIELSLNPESVLKFIPADGESKFYKIMEKAKKGEAKHLAYIAGSDHRNVLDTHKKTMGLMLDTIGKLALKVKQFNAMTSLEYNSVDHTVAYLCNVRDPKEIDNQKLLRQLGFILLGLEKHLLDPAIVGKTFRDTNIEAIKEGDQIIDNYFFIKEHMTSDYEIRTNYYIAVLNKLNKSTLLDQKLLWNVDNVEDKTVFNLRDAITALEADQEEIMDFIIETRDELLKILSLKGKTEFLKSLESKTLEIMQKILKIENIQNGDEVTSALEKLLGIKLKVNYASTAFSSTQVRDFFTGKSTEGWASLFLPLKTLGFIEKLLKTENAYYMEEAHTAYGIDDTLSSKPDAGITSLLRK